MKPQIPGSHTRRLGLVAAVLVLVVVGGAVWASQRSTGLPKRACWGTVDRSILTDAAPESGSWEVSESTDRWGDPTCTVRRGAWAVDVTLMKTPLRTHLWWQLGAVSLGGRLPGMVKPGTDRTDGWLYLTPCGQGLVNVNVPAVGLDDRVSVDLTARLLLAVGDARLRDCGGQTPFDPADLRDLDPRPRDAGQNACGITGLPARWDGEGEELSRIGGVDVRAAVSRCAILDRDDAASAAAFGPGLFSVTVIHNRQLVDALSPTGVRATVTATRGVPLELSDEDLRYDRDAVTEVRCDTTGDSTRGSRFVHVFTTGSDADYAHAKRAVLNFVAEELGCG
ncbi:hypothetical protein [Yinghuangia sp. YIM S09857]|uniref:hypothetical protein n=1 Tax=Yinghuangia sp. YIM S09857 TaxID=3436929 RepID=UPI003F52B952